jgi:hypothetical protein
LIPCRLVSAPSFWMAAFHFSRRFGSDKAVK